MKFKKHEEKIIYIVNRHTDEKYFYDGHGRFAYSLHDAYLYKTVEGFERNMERVKDYCKKHDAYTTGSMYPNLLIGTFNV